MSILDTIQNEDTCIELVHEYFNGKYTKDEVKILLYQFNAMGNLNVRRGVAKLSEEWNKLKNYDESTINNWYKETDFYIFDLLPWNACSMFIDKMNQIYPVIEECKINTLIDYGGGLGISSFLLKEKFPTLDITYCDFQTGHQFKFCEFLMKKLGITGIRTIDVDALLNGLFRSHTDAVLAMDCFEHIPDLNATLKRLLIRTNLLIHDSTFHRNEAQPQHVNDKGEHWFINLMLSHSFYMPSNDFRVFRRFKMEIQNNGELAMMFYDPHDDIYAV
jgi:hypothetical protein